MTQIRAGLHNHTTMCDGKNSAREMAEAAIAAGFTDFGFSGHGHTPFDLSYSLKDEAGYIREIRALQKEYAGRIRLYCGLEQDYFAPTQRREAYDCRRMHGKSPCRGRVRPAFRPQTAGGKNRHQARLDLCQQR